jgi:hypothetical protein
LSIFYLILTCERNPDESIPAKSLDTQPRRHPMPQILIVTESPEETPSTVVYRERVALSDFESTHFTGQLAERVGWAVSDADRLEHKSEEATPATAASREPAAA